MKRRNKTYGPLKENFQTVRAKFKRFFTTGRRDAASDLLLQSHDQLPVVVDLLSDNDDQTKKEAMHLLDTAAVNEIDISSSSSKIIELLSDTNRVVQIIAVRTLPALLIQGVDISPAFKQLQRLLSVDNFNVQKDVIGTLAEAARIGADTSRWIPRLKELVSGGDFSSSYNAAMILSSGDHETARSLGIPMMIRLLSSSNEGVVFCAVTDIVDVARRGHAQEIVTQIMELQASVEFRIAAEQNNSYYVRTIETVGKVLESLWRMEAAA